MGKVQVQITTVGKERAKIIQAALRKIYIEAAQEMVAEMRQRVRSESGNTRASIRYEVLDNGDVRIMAGGPLTEVVTSGGRTFDYVRSEEYGTRTHPAHPFFYVVVRAKLKKVQDQIAAALKRELAFEQWHQ